MKCLFFFPSKWSQNVSFESWFLNKNWTQKLSFRKIFFLQNMIFRKDLFSKAARMKNFQFKTNLTFWKFFISNFHCAGKPFFQNLILFFLGKLHFKLWLSMKEFATKSCLLKWARKVINLLLSAEQIESKRYFLYVMFFIEIWFLKKKLNSKSNFQN